MRKVLIKLIKLYQKIPGDFHYFCKYTPSCSNYAIDAINEYGSFKGCILSLFRIIRCNPFSKGGYDPVKKRSRKMKKFKCLLLVFMLSFTTTGCFKSDTMEDITIYTSVYPIEYITERLYGDYSDVLSIYPDGIDVNNYELTKKQINDYSNVELFIFNGLTNEKDYVTDFFKENKKIKIIDGTSSMEVLNKTEELWLNPSNLLMISQNIKNGFNEYITSHYIKEDILKNYEDLKLEISNLDANISKVAENSTYNVIIVTNDMFNYLSKYGFKVISLENANEKTISEAYNYIRSGQTKHIFVPKNYDLNDTASKLIDDTNVEVLELHSLSNISEYERKNNKDYISLMNENINQLKLELYK